MPGNTIINMIEESPEIKHFLSFMSYDTSAILFDLDNTVGWPGTYLGSDQWFVRLFEYIGHCIPDKAIREALAVRIYHEVQRRSEMQAVEKKVIHLIRCLQSIGFPIIAITSRGEEIEQATREQLSSLDIQFDDIIFCSGKPKGEELLRWININQPQWEKVVMIDDKEKHLLNVAESLSLLGISFQGLRYSNMDTFFKNDDNCDSVHDTLKCFSWFSEQTKASIEPVISCYQQLAV